MNLDLAHSQGRALVVSAFTVQADARKGRRPSFDSAARGDEARSLYQSFCDAASVRRSDGGPGSLRRLHESPCRE